MVILRTAVHDSICERDSRISFGLLQQKAAGGAAVKADRGWQAGGPRPPSETAYGPTAESQDVIMPDLY